MRINKNLDASGTSFHGTTIKTTAKKIKSFMGESLWSCSKTSYNWVALTDDGNLFTVYDYKEGNISENTEVFFHIGGFNKETTEKAKSEMLDHLYRMNS